MPWIVLTGAFLAGSWEQRAPAQAAPAEAAAAPASDATSTANDVFSGSEFWWKRIETSTVPNPGAGGFLDRVIRLLRKIVEWVVDLIRKILGMLFGGLGGGIAGGRLILLLILAGLLAWAAWKLAPLLRSWLVRAPVSPAVGAVDHAEALADASVLFEQARRAFREGQYAEAIRLALLSQIAHFERLGLLRYDPTRTNREYQRELRPRHDLATGFGQLARIYERVWYGRLTASPAEAEQAIELCGAVVARREPAPG
jgi:hypothetical protein